MPKRLIPISLLLFFELVADYFAAQWWSQQKLFLAFVAIFFYIVCNVFWLFALKHGVWLGKWSIIFSVGSAILAICLWYLVFHEHYSPYQIVWIVLWIVALLLVNIE